MRCGEVMERLSEYVDGGLDPVTREKVGKHIESCATCGGEHALLERIVEEARRLPGLSPGDETVLRIGEAIRETAAQPIRTEFGAVMTLSELCAFLRVDGETIAPYLPDIPFFELGGRLLFQRKSVEEWIQQRENWAMLEVTAPSIDGIVMPEGAKTGGVSWKR